MSIVYRSTPSDHRSAAVPEYESALSKGSLLRPPLADAVPALVRHAHAKKLKALLDALKEAGAEAFLGHHVLLDSATTPAERAAAIVADAVG